MISLSIGIDIGKRHDPTAIVVCVAEERRNQGRWETHFSIPFLKRLELNTPYPDQARQLLEISKKATLKFWEDQQQKNRTGMIRGQYQIYVDVTGVGDAVVDMLKPGAKSIGPLHPCRFVAGDRINKVNYKEYMIGKAHFVSRLQVLAESKLIHLPPGHPEAQQLSQEMLDFDIDVDETSGKATFGAMRPGTHDDLVCALGLACLIDPHKNYAVAGPKPVGL
jgi:hypothetical protein